MHKFIFSVGFLCNVFLTGNGQTILPYQNKNLSTQKRVDDLLQRMNRHEKWMQLFMVPGEKNWQPNEFKNGIFGLQVNAWVNAENPTQQLLTYDTVSNLENYYDQVKSIKHHFKTNTRLGIPPILFAETLHGIVAPNVSVFPQAIALAATFDTSLMHSVANYIATECKALSINQVLSPVVNLATDVRWGRVEETYGEDPYLASAMAVAYVSAFEKNNIITTPKHFVANVGDGGRDSYPVDYSKRHMLEYDFIPFKSCFDFGKSRSVMTAYNALNGKSCSTNKVLLQQILKDEWKFKGFVISDAGAVGGANVLLNTTKNYTASGKEAIAAGLDVIFQTSVTHEQLFNEPFLSGEMDTAMDKAVTRVLTAKFELGLFDNITEATIPPSHPKDADTLAFEAAVKSLVLLQNNGILPLTQKQKVAVIGTDAIEKRMGGYSGNNNYIVSILDGIKSKSPNVAFSAGPGRGDNFQVIGSEYFIGANNENVKALYYNNISWQGQPVMQFESNLNHHCTFMPPAKNISNTFYSVKWMASLKAPFTGLCNMGLRGNDGYTLSVNGKPHISRTSKISFHNDVKPYNFIKDSLYLIEVTFYESVGDGSVALVWDAFSSQENIKKSVAIASEAEVIVFVAGINEGEFNDRASLQLPGMQEALLDKLFELKKPVVVLLVGGSAVTMSWLQKADAVMQVWYPGQQGGHAIASVLYGTSPSGKLPFTWPVSEAQLPLVYNHKPTGRGNDYTDLSGKPLFPFGYGLSYSTFSYSNLQLSKAIIKSDENLTVSCSITNTGIVKADEVIQLYIKDKVASYAQPVMALKGFKRLQLQPNESKKVTFKILPHMLTVLDDNLKPVVEPGFFEVLIGASSADIKLRTEFEVK